MVVVVAGASSGMGARGRRLPPRERERTWFSRRVILPR